MPSPEACMREVNALLRERIAELEAALAPFARFDTEDWSDDMRAFADDPTLTMRHFRAAKAALQKSTR